MPEYQSEHAAAMDLHAAVPHPFPIEPGTVALIPCGFALAIPIGFEGQIRPRSGLASRNRLIIPNSPATIDADYRGEVVVPLMNLATECFEVTRNMRIAQLLILPVPRVDWVRVETLPPTKRGTGGFGHTGM